MIDISVKAAQDLAASKWWETKTDEEIVRFQLFTERLCMPFDRFHKAVEVALGRPVWSHEFAFPDSLQKEFLKEKPAPTMADILHLIPEAKRLIVVTP